MKVAALTQFAGVNALCLASAVLAGQIRVAAQIGLPSPPRIEPLPNGQQFDLRDGDLVVVEDDARIKVVRRYRAVVRAVYSAPERLLTLLLDGASAAGPNDGKVDAVLTFRQIEGNWPLGERWQGEALVEEYQLLLSPPQNVSTRSLGLQTNQGMIQIFPSSGPAGPQLHIDVFRNPAAIASMYYSGGGGFSSGANRDFDQAEKEANDRVRSSTQGVWQSWGGTITSGPGTATTQNPASGVGAIRAGGNVQQPRKIHDVAPIYPEAARQARISGVVIVEITVGVDGSVTAARVLRSLPMLDAAALEAARQWRYEPTAINGVAVPVTVVVPVPFAAE